MSGLLILGPVALIDVAGLAEQLGHLLLDALGEGRGPVELLGALVAGEGAVASHRHGRETFGSLPGEAAVADGLGEIVGTCPRGILLGRDVGRVSGLGANGLLLIVVVLDIVDLDIVLGLVPGSFADALANRRGLSRSARTEWRRRSVSRSPRNIMIASSITTSPRSSCPMSCRTPETTMASSASSRSSSRLGSTSFAILRACW